MVGSNLGRNGIGGCFFTQMFHFGQLEDPTNNDGTVYFYDILNFTS